MKRAARELRTAREAVRFFTRWPLPSAAAFPEEIRWSMTYFPLIGWLAGGAGAAALWLASRFWPLPVAVGISLGVTILFTGGLHEDGLADVCDGFGGGMSQERILAIMKDSRIGVFGSLGLLFSLLLKWLLLLSWAQNRGRGLDSTMIALLSAHALSRGSVCAVQSWLPYVGGDGSKARPLTEPLRGRRASIAALFALTPLGYELATQRLPIFNGVFALLAVAAVASGLAFCFKRKIGGWTGDCLGAVQQITELTFYLVGVAQWREGFGTLQ